MNSVWPSINEEDRERARGPRLPFELLVANLVLSAFFWEGGLGRVRWVE